MNRAAYLEAAIPTPFRVLNLQLRPFCIGHYLCLARVGSPIVNDPLKTNEAHLIQAVILCGLTFEEGASWLNDDTTNPAIKKWRKSLKRVDLIGSFELFTRYLEDGLRRPEVWEAEEGGEAIGAHWTEYLVVSLTSFLGYSESEAYNMYLPLAQRRVAVFWEIKTRKKILVSEQDEQDTAKAREISERLRAKLCRN